MNPVTLTYLILFITSALATMSYRIPKMQSNVFILLSSWGLFIGLHIWSAIFGYQQWLFSSYALFKNVDFYSIVVDGMLCYLLFAGCLHVDISSFIHKMKIILTLAIVTTLCSFVFTAALVYAVFMYLGVDLPWLTPFIYAAVIAPTDPVAVLALLKNLNLSKELYAKVASESLLNDGVGVVLFLTVLKFADSPQLDMSAGIQALEFFAREGLGGLALGAGLAYFLLSAPLKSIRQEPRVSNQLIFLLMTLLNLGFLCAKALHVSPPLVAVGSGLWTSYILQDLSEQQRSVVHVFWDTLDEIMNYVLFFIVGFQSMFINVSSIYVRLMFWAVIVNFIVRVLAVCIPLLAIRVGYKNNATLYKTLVIGGLKGGLSLALALSIPRDYPGFTVIFDMTYAVVGFTVIVQGLSIERYLKLLKMRSESVDVVI